MLLRSLTLCAALAATPAQPQAIQLVPYATLEPRLSARIDFESLPRLPSPGRNIDGIARFTGARIAERFAGQVTLSPAGFDELHATPTPPLRLEPGLPGQNLAVEFVFFMSNQLKGMAPPGFPERSAGGEGAVSILFDRDQNALGFRVASEPEPHQPAPKGRMTVSFFTRDGALIETLEVELDWLLAGYGFARAGATSDIAGISITNRDPQGVMIDDIIFDAPPVFGWLTSAP